MNKDILITIYDVFEEHTDQRGKPQRNDRRIWQLIDQLTRADFDTIIELTAGTRHWNHTTEDWCCEVLERQPFYIRAQAERFKSNANNTRIWQLLMLMYERLLRAKNTGSV